MILLYYRSQHKEVVGMREPIQTEWHKTCADGLVKEVLGGKAFFKWCCGRRMRRILGY